MANNTGTLVTSPIRPQSDADTFPSSYADEALGGHHQVATLTERDAIPAARRKEGMQCAVAETDRVYKLKGGTDNSNWVVVLTSQDEELIRIADTGAYRRVTLVTASASGFPLVSNVVWPDLEPGVLTAVEETTVPGALRSYQVTWGNPVRKTITQPAVQWNPATRRVTDKPEATIA